MGVKFPEKEKLYHGVVLACNLDGTYQIKYDSGVVHASISREMVRLYHNDIFMEVGEENYLKWVFVCGVGGCTHMHIYIYV